MAQDLSSVAIEVTHPTVFDTGEQHLGKVYAKALLGATEKAGKTEAVMAEFDSLVDDVLDKLPKLDAVLASPRIGHAAKERILDQAFKGKMSAELLNFLKVTSKHGRLEMLRAIRRAAHEQYNKLRGRVEVLVRTAHPMDPPLMQKLVARLKETLQNDVDLTTSVDPELIGGMVVRVGDTVYDGSVANRLKRMRAQTVNKVSQEIRQTLERFALTDTK